VHVESVSDGDEDTESDEGDEQDGELLFFPEMVSSFEQCENPRSGGWSPGRFFGEEGEDEVVKPRGGVFERKRFVEGDFFKEAGEGSGLEGRVSAEEGIESGSEGVEVGGGGEFGLVVDLLGGEKFRGAGDGAVAGEVGGGIEGAGKAEVHHDGSFGIAIVKDVRGFDVPVKGSLAVGVVEGASDIAGDGDDLLDWERAMVGEQLLKGLAFQKGRAETGRGSVFVNSIERHEILMLKLGGGAGFAEKAFTAVGLDREFGGENFDGDMSVELGMVCLVDGAGCP